MVIDPLAISCLLLLLAATSYGDAGRCQSHLLKCLTSPNNPHPRSPVNISDPTTPPTEGATATVAETNTATQTATVNTGGNATSDVAEKVEQPTSKKPKKKKGSSSKAKAPATKATKPTAAKAPAAKKAKATVKTEKKPVVVEKKPVPAKRWRKSPAAAKSSVATRRTTAKAKTSNKAMKGPIGVKVGVGRGGNQPKGEMSGRAKRCAIAMAIALRSPKGLISIEGFRAICQQKNVYNAANFTQDMKKDAKYFKPILQKGVVVGWTLTSLGKKKAVEQAAKVKQ